MSQIDPLSLLRLLRNPNPREAIQVLGPVVLPRVADYCARRYLPEGVLDRAGGLADRYAQSRDRFLDRLAEAPSGLYVILGAPGTGKTAFALALAEHIARPTYAVNIRGEALPAWIKPLDALARAPEGDVVGADFQSDSIGEVPAGSVVIVDDAGQVASSRDYQSAAARALEDLLAVYRHKDLVVIVTTTAANTVHTALLDATAFFVKPPSMFRKAAERRELRWLMDLAGEAWAQVAEAERKHYVFAVSESPAFAGMVDYDLPYGWTEATSKNKAEQQP